MKSEINIGYNETIDKLSIRIEANKKYSNFSLEAWLEQNLPFKEGNKILDVGCGSGNLFPSYSDRIRQTGVIVGFDQSGDLLAEAALVNIITPVVLLQLNMNNPLPFVPGSFDYVISTFAIYYVEDVTLIAEDIRRVLKRHGEFIFIGPTDKNARELYDLNKMVFKIDRTERIDKRTNRIEKEFYPVMSKLFKHVTTMIIPNKLIFPNKKEYLKYYLATLLFEESVKEANRKFDLHHLEEIDLPSLEISKEMIMLRGESAD